MLITIRTFPVNNFSDSFLLKKTRWPATWQTKATKNTVLDLQPRSSAYGQLVGLGPGAWEFLGSPKHEKEVFSLKQKKPMEGPNETKNPRFSIPNHRAPN